MHQRQVLVGRGCLALILEPGKSSDGDLHHQDRGRALFTSLLLQNSSSFWNGCLVRSVASLEYRGCLAAPATLLVSGSDLALEVVRSAWARRVLRPPAGYAISRLGDIGGLSMLPVAQTQFAPLPEALCEAVADLQADRLPATASSIRSRLARAFPEMRVPGDEVLHRTLGVLIRERKLYHAGSGYRVVTPETYRPPPSPPRERPMLLSTEEAIVRLHGRGRTTTRAIQADEADIDFCCGDQPPCSATRPAPAPKEPWRTSGVPLLPHSESKQTVLAKLLRRVQLLGGASRHQLVFSAQFPPLEWLEAADLLRCHSVATQTKQPIGKKRTAKALMEQRVAIAKEEGFGSSKPSFRPLAHHGTLTTKRKHHRSSSSGSPKVRSSSSRSNGEDGAYESNSSSKRCQKLSYKPFDRPEWRRLFNYGNPTPDSPEDAKDVILDADVGILSEVENAPSSPEQQTEKEELLPDQTYQEVADTPSDGHSSAPAGGSPTGSKSGSIELPPREPLNPAHQGKKPRYHNRGEDRKDGAREPTLNDEARPEKQQNTSGSPGSRSDVEVPPCKPTPQHGKKKPSRCRTGNDEVREQRINDEARQPPNGIKANGNKEIVVDNTVCVEVAVHPKSASVSTTVVTEETTIAGADGNPKIVTVTSVTTTSVTGGSKAGPLLDEHIANDLSREKSSKREDDVTSSCNIETEVVG